jgi:FtsP/CotA-like multicopper oxidase with cupredoxin domain
VLAAGTVTNVSAIPPEYFNVCTPTNGAKEVIEVKKSSCHNETWVSLDLIGAFGVLTSSVSIDETPLYIYAVDGEYIEPQTVEAIIVTNGDRYSVFAKLTTPGDYTIRVSSVSDAQIITGTATLRYIDPKQTNSTKQSTPYINEGGKPLSPDVRFFDQTKMRSFPPDTVAQKADQLVRLSMRVAGQSYEWALNNTVYPMALDSANPLLFNRPPLMPENNVTISTRNGTWVDLLFQSVTAPMPPHPLHKHGNKMFMIGAGEGAFNYSSVEEAIAAIPQNFNLVNPPKRDGLATPPAITGPAWMIARYQVVNPGAWLLHCHIRKFFCSCTHGFD